VSGDYWWKPGGLGRRRLVRRTLGASGGAEWRAPLRSRRPTPPRAAAAVAATATAAVPPAARRGFGVVICESKLGRLRLY
jgi:hypothetical protein